MITINKLSTYTFGILLTLMFFTKSEFSSVFIYLFILLLILVHDGFYIDKYLKKLIFVLGLIVVIGFLNVYFDFRVIDYSISTRDIIKDIWFFSRPIFLLFIGYNLGKKIIPENIIKVIFILGIISASYHYFQIIQFGSLNILSGKNQGLLMTSSFIEAILLGILIIKLVDSDKFVFNSKVLNNQSLLILIACFILPSAILYLSRTMIVILLALLFFGLELYKINFKSVAICALALMGIGYITLLESSDIYFVQKIQRSATEIGISSSDYEARIDENNINSVWRGYEAYRGVLQLAENNKFVWLWGEGLGSKVDLKIQKELGGQVFRFIPRLHNGYIMVLFKFGLIGLILYLFVIYKMIFGLGEKSFHSVRNEYFFLKIAKGIGLSTLLTSIVISGIYHSGVGMLVFIFITILGSLRYDGPYEARPQNFKQRVLAAK